MPDLAPFRALRFSGSAGDAGTLLAPPYDVIDAAAARELRRRGPYNCVRLILPEDGEERHETAARLLEAWRAGGVLVEDDAPAAWVYRQSYPHDGGRRRRLALLAALRLSPFGEGEVLPHEETHSAPREDRLRLTLACHAQLSPVLLVARDPDGGFLSRLSSAVDDAGPAFLDGETPDGMQHELWRVAEGPAAALCAAAGAGPLLIADGHHRYETALEVRRRLPESGAAERVLACVVPASDPGLLLPTHRALRRAPAGGWEVRLRGGFVLRRLPSADPAAAAREAAGAGGAALAAVVPGAGAAWLLEAAGERAADPLDGIAAAVFDRRALRPLFGMDPDRAAAEGLLSYHRDPTEAARAAGADGAEFLLPPVALEAVWRAAEAGARLPPKTTYFHPKVPSGLLFRPL